MLHATLALTCGIDTPLCSAARSVTHSCKRMHVMQHCAAIDKLASANARTPVKFRALIGVFTFWSDVTESEEKDERAWAAPEQALPDLDAAVIAAFAQRPPADAAVNPAPPVTGVAPPPPQPLSQPVPPASAQHTPTTSIPQELAEVLQGATEEECQFVMYLYYHSDFVNGFMDPVLKVVDNWARLVLALFRARPVLRQVYGLKLFDVDDPAEAWQKLVDTVGEVRLTFLSRDERLVHWY
jgi:hypothetical protein